MSNRTLYAFSQLVGLGLPPDLRALRYSDGVSPDLADTLADLGKLYTNMALLMHSEHFEERNVATRYM